jgi:hypothetical protein
MIQTITTVIGWTKCACMMHELRLKPHGSFGLLQGSPASSPLPLTPRQLITAPKHTDDFKYTTQAMPFPIGVSPTDFVGGAEFVHSVYQALKSSTGSKSQYAGVLSALKNLEYALSTIEAIGVTGPEQQSVEEAVEQIKACVSRFHAKIEKYEPSLGSKSTDKWWRSLPRKIQWQRYSLGDVKYFRDELSQHALPLQLLLAKMQRWASMGAEGNMLANLSSSSTVENHHEAVSALSSLEHQVDQTESRLRRAFDQQEIAAQTRSLQMTTEITAQFSDARSLIDERHNESTSTATRLFNSSESAARERFELGEQKALERHDRADAAAKLRLAILLTLLVQMYVDIKALICVAGTRWIQLLEHIFSSIPRNTLTQALTVLKDAHGFIYHIDTQFVQTWEVSGRIIP